MPKKYKVQITEYALNQIIEIKNYIQNELESPETAKIWLDNMKSSLGSLSTFPARFPIIAEKLFNLDIHRFIVGKHLVYYWINEQQHTVWIIAVIYARRDQMRELKNLIL